MIIIIAAIHGALLSDSQVLSPCYRMSLSEHACGVGNFHSHSTDEQTGSEQLPSCPQVTEPDCGGARISSQLYLIPSLPHSSDLLGPRISRKQREREMRARADGGDLERYTKEP